MRGVCDDAGLEPRGGWFGKGDCMLKSSLLLTEGEGGLGFWRLSATRSPGAFDVRETPLSVAGYGSPRAVAAIAF